MERSGSSAENILQRNEIQPNVEGLSEDDRKLLFGIVQDIKASHTLREMARDVLRRHGIPISGSDGTGNQETLSPMASSVSFGSVSPSNDHHGQLQMLGTCQFNMRTVADSQRMNHFLPGNIIQIPTYYPQLPVGNLCSMEHFRTLSLERLFFVFYHNEGTYSQKIAAEVLKEYAWRFHTKYMMWFRRLIEPDFQNQEFETVNSYAFNSRKGTYVYFDIEQWKERIQYGFVFEYKYLENSYPS